MAILQAAAGHAQDTATKAIFWHQIAPLGDALYCSANGDEIQTHTGYSIEHIYPRSWMSKTLGCEGDACKGNEKYVYWESDLNNLWPAKVRVNGARGDRAFGELDPSDEWRGGECGAFRSRGTKVAGSIKTNGIVEPPDSDKGIVARAILYVQDVYGGLLPDGQREVLERWAVEHPVTAVECARQAVIVEVQTLTNPYIRCPAKSAVDPRPTRNFD